MTALLLLLALARADVGPPPPTPRPAPPAPSCPAPGIDARAVLGKLTPDDRECLEGRVARGEDAVVAARMLTADAWARDDRVAYVTEAERYLALDPTDAHIAAQLAREYGRTRRPADELRCAELALAHRDRLARRTWALEVRRALQLRAEAATALWEEAPADEALRARATTTAAQWADFTTTHSGDATQALALCARAATDGVCPSIPHELGPDPGGPAE